MGRSRTAAMLLAVAIALMACDGSGGADRTPVPPTPVPEPVVVAAGAPIQIGVSAAFSGDRATLGVDIADAAELAVADFGGSVAGHPVTVVRMDDGCADPEKAVAVARDLVAMPALAGVIGPMCTTGAQAGNTVYEAAGVAHISATTTRAGLSEQGERYFFRTAWRDDMQSSTQVAYARNVLGAASAVVIDDGDPYGRGLADAFTQQFEERGGRVLSRERIRRGTTDFAALVRQIVAVAPSIVVFEGLNPEGPLIVRALREGEYAGAFIGPDGLLSNRDFLPTAGGNGEGAILTGGATPSGDFEARFAVKYARTPGTPFVLQAHDAMTALLRAIAAIAEPQPDGGLRIDRARIAEAIRSEEFEGFTGAIAFDERGDRRGETARQLGLTIYRVTNGAFEVIE